MKPLRCKFLNEQPIKFEATSKCHEGKLYPNFC